MFENIGSKLQALAKVICWVGIIASVILGIVLISSGGNFFLGLLYAVIGGLASWVGSWVTYAIGEIAERTEQISYQLSKTSEGRSTGISKTSVAPASNSPLSNAAASYEQEKKRGEWTCLCGAKNSNTAAYCYRCRRSRNEINTPKVTCPHCGAQNRITNTVCFACNKSLKTEE